MPVGKPISVLEFKVIVSLSGARPPTTLDLDSSTTEPVFELVMLSWILPANRTSDSTMPSSGTNSSGCDFGPQIRNPRVGNKLTH
jgi:hypothetical protein